jgi:hypothetical protein
MILPPLEIMAELNLVILSSMALASKEGSKIYVLSYFLKLFLL